MDELDPRKLYELSESLNELTGTVKYASQAMQAMLGPQAEANKKLRESGKKRADVEKNAAEQRDKELKREVEADVKQKKLFDDELRYRGYKIDATGNLNKTTVSYATKNTADEAPTAPKDVLTLIVNRLRPCEKACVEWPSSITKRPKPLLSRSN